MSKPGTPKQYKTTNKLSLFFTNKGVEIINFPKVLHSKNALSEMPGMLFLWLTVNYSNLLVLNNSTIKCLQSFLTLIPLSKTKPFYYVTVKIHHLYILNMVTSRDLRIARINKLKKLIIKGPKYREPSTICWDKAKLSILDEMNGNVEQLSNKLDINKLQFSEWKDAILSHIDKRKVNFEHQKSKSILNNTFIKECLEKLQHDFAVAQIDKPIMYPCLKGFMLLPYLKNLELLEYLIKHVN